ncbi:MAG: hypothetical protein MAG431_01076 [Chloroflexi bacterium]|nr:hypothetical protein [Chloroflexota bacterium]
MANLKDKVEAEYESIIRLLNEMPERERLVANVEHVFLTFKSEIDKIFEK